MAVPDNLCDGNGKCILIMQSQSSVQNDHAMGKHSSSWNPAGKKKSQSRKQQNQTNSKKIHSTPVS